jgi:hypothetical protein
MEGQYFKPTYSQQQRSMWDKYAKENIVTGRSSKIIPGNIYIYNYQAKGHDDKTLPFYDAYPLVLVIDVDSKYLLGLSLHYLPKPVRKFFIKKVLINNFDRLKKGMPAKLPYADIRDASNLWYQEGIVIIKRYLRNRITSYVTEIPWRKWVNIVDGEGAHWIDTTAEEVYKQTKLALQNRFKNRNKIIQNQAQRAADREKNRIQKLASNGNMSARMKKKAIGK